MPETLELNDQAQTPAAGTPAVDENRSRQLAEVEAVRDNWNDLLSPAFRSRADVKGNNDAAEQLKQDVLDQAVIRQIFADNSGGVDMENVGKSKYKEVKAIVAAIDDDADTIIDAMAERLKKKLHAINVCATSGVTFKDSAGLPAIEGVIAYVKYTEKKSTTNARFASMRVG